MIDGRLGYQNGTHGDIHAHHFLGATNTYLHTADVFFIPDSFGVALAWAGHFTTMIPDPRHYTCRANTFSTTFPTTFSMQDAAISHHDHQNY